MQTFSFFKAIPFSFFSKALYRDVARHWKGLGYTYILMLLFLAVTGVFSFYLVKLHRLDTSRITRDLYKEEMVDKGVTFEDAVNSGLNMLSQLPPLTLHKGEVSVDAPEPYTIMEPISKTPVMIIDTTGKYTNLQHTEAFILLTKNTLVTKEKKDKERVTYLSGKTEEEEKDITSTARILAQWPLLILKNGHFATDAPQPYSIKNPETHEVAGIIDMTGHYTSLKGTEAPLLVTASEIYFKSHNTQTNKDETHVIEAADINAENVLQLIEKSLPVLIKYLTIAAICLIPFVTLYYFVGLILITLLIGLVGTLFAWTLKIKTITYPEAVRLTAIASTPAIFLSIFTPLSLGIRILITLGFVFFAVFSNRDTPDTLLQPQGTV